MAAVTALIYTLILNGNTDAVIAEGFFSDADISEIVADRFPEPDADWYTIEYDEAILEVLTSPDGEEATIERLLASGDLLELV